MMYQLNDAFEPSQWLNNGGIFTFIGAVQGDYQIPWSVSPMTLDIDYHGNHSGDKLASPLLQRFLKMDDGSLTNIHKGMLAAIIYNRFMANWVKRWNALQIVYNPLENYNRHEEVTDDTTTRTHGKTDTMTHGKTTTRTGSVNHSEGITITQESSIYGYDNATASPSGRTVTTPSAGSNTDSYSNLADAESGTTVNAESGTTKDVHTYESDISGNIGVTTSQQMLESELQIRTYDFFQSVYKDVDSILTIPVY